MSMRRYWIVYFSAVLSISPLMGYVLAECHLTREYDLLIFLLSYIVLGMFSVYGYCKISDLDIGWATAATFLFAIPGIGLIMLINATIWSEDIAPTLFWALTESMLAIGFSNALGMCIAPAFKKRGNREQ